VLLPPHNILDIPAALANKVAISVATHYGITVATAYKYIPAQLSQLGKVSHLEGGDTIHAWDLVCLSEMNRDASYVRVRILVYMTIFLHILSSHLFVTLQYT